MRFIAIILVSASLLAAPPEWESGKPIPVGTPDRLGPLGIGLTSYPVGWANVTGARRPDLFAVARRRRNPLDHLAFSSLPLLVAARDEWHRNTPPPPRWRTQSPTPGKWRGSRDYFSSLLGRVRVSTPARF